MLASVVLSPLGRFVMPGFSVPWRVGVILSKELGYGGEYGAGGTSITFSPLGAKAGHDSFLTTSVRKHCGVVMSQAPAILHPGHDTGWSKLRLV